MMRGSQLDRRITIQANTPLQSASSGSMVDSWATFNSLARIPAQVQDQLPSKAESTDNGLRQAKRIARVRIRYVAGITSAMRFVLHGESDVTMQIISQPAEIGRREWLEFMAESYSTAAS
jgi:head-tail adaptor